MGKTIALITGASSGLGRLYALGVGSRYSLDELWVVARSGDKLEALRQETDVPLKIFALDLTEEESLNELKRALDKERPAVKILMNVSGYGKFERFERIAQEDNLGMIDLNCRALTAVTQLAFPYFAKGAIVVNVASVAAFMPLPYGAVYAASKAYVLSFTRAINREWKGGVRAIAVCPYWTDTRFIDRGNDKDFLHHFGKLYSPEYVAEKTFRAMKRGRDYVVIGKRARALVRLLKIFPKRLAMNVFIRTQRKKI